MNHKRLVQLTTHALSALIAAIWTLTGCTPAQAGPTPPAASETSAPTETHAFSAGLANPASVHCEGKGHNLEIRTGRDGNQFGVCVFADGSECEEWAYLRGECSPGASIATAAAPPTVTPVAAASAAAPSAEPASECAPITVESGPEFRLWREYVHEQYGFALLVPPGWALEEITEPPQHTLRDHAYVLWPAEEPTARFQVAFRSLDEEQFIGRTGVGSGEIVEAGTACFCGQEVDKRRLVFRGKDMTVLYGGREIVRGNMAFTLYLDYRGGWEDKSALSKEIQVQVDQIIATFQLADGS